MEERNGRTKRKNIYKFTLAATVRRICSSEHDIKVGKLFKSYAIVRAGMQ